MARVKQVAVKSVSGVAPRKQLAHKSGKKRPRKQHEDGGEGAQDAGGEGAAGATDRQVVVVKGRRRYRSGTVAVREIRRLAKSTNLLFPKAPFDRLVREVAQVMKSDVRFTRDGILAIHEAAEQFITEKFIKADMARRHAKRKTLHIDDLRFTPFMTHVVSEVVGNNLEG